MTFEVPLPKTSAGSEISLSVRMLTSDRPKDIGASGKNEVVN